MTPRPHRIQPAPLLAAACILLLFGCGDPGGEPPAETRTSSPPVAADAPPELPLGRGDCKMPAPEDESLVLGLAPYAEGDWSAASRHLTRWAAQPDADADPAAGRGLYSLGYALTAQNQQARAAPYYERSAVLLQRDADTSPTLEGLYYLASLRRNRRETDQQLAVVSQALGLLERGSLCPAPDADDDFRRSRIAAFAGREAERVALLESAIAKYELGQGAVHSYHALALQELGERARGAGDPATWEQNLRKAAELDPAIPGVHRSLGLAMLQRGDVAGAAEYWRRHWREERGGGNSLVYAVRVLQQQKRFAERFGDEQRITNLADHTVEALEQNAIYEAGRMMRLAGELAQAEEPDPDQELERDVAHYRMLQLLTEYVARERDLQEFALQNGLLPAIHGRGLPRR